MNIHCEIFYAEPYIERDIRRIVALIDSTRSGSHATKAGVIDFAANHSIFVARTRNEIIHGVCTLEISGFIGKDFATIHDLVVHPNFIRFGVERELLKKVVWYARERGAVYIDISADLSNLCPEALKEFTFHPLKQRTRRMRLSI